MERVWRRECIRSRSEDIFEMRGGWERRAKVRPVLTSWSSKTPGVFPVATVVAVAVAVTVGVVVAAVVAVVAVVAAAAEVVARRI